MKIAFVGAGRMAEALIARLKSHSIIASDINTGRLQYLKKRYRTKIAEDNQSAFLFGEIIVLAVKPQQMAEVLNNLGTGTKKLIISIAAGIPLSYLQKKLPGFSIIRAMPNNPCLIGEGITALAAGKKVGRKEMIKAVALFNSVGEVLEVPEKWMDAVTGLSGSGPAFVYLMIEALIKGGIQAGLPERAAAKLALQTMIGAAKTVKQTGRTPAELREMVTSPGGTTIEGLDVLKKAAAAEAVARAVVEASRKSRRLSQKWTL